jgi:rhodanese-related sulfurtransferase
MPPATIATAELRRLRVENPDLRLVDVRTGGEFESSHIPGAYNVPLHTLGEHAGDLATLEHPVVLVCQSGARADTAKTTLDAAGKTGLYVLDGGMNAWQAAGGEVNTSDQPKWAMDRQVRLVAGSLVVAGVLASIAAPKAKLLAGAVGGGLVFSAVSNTCAMGNLLARLPYNRGPECDVDAVLDQLRHRES